MEAGTWRASTGDEIPMVGRILGIADAFSAMTTSRAYRKAMPLRESLRRLEDSAGSQLDPDLVIPFVRGMETASDAPLPGDERRPIPGRPHGRVLAHLAGRQYASGRELIMQLEQRVIGELRPS